MRRFDTPAGPPGWAGQGAELLRVVDPTGRAIAWLAPGLGGNCVGYAVRQEGLTAGGWRHILRASGPRELRADPLGYGVAVIGPGAGDQHQAHRAAWQFVERDPTAATCTVLCGPDHSGDLFAVRLDLTARLEDAALHLDLVATNEGEAGVTVALGLRVCLVEDFLSDGPGQETAQTVKLHSADGLVRMIISSGAGASGHAVHLAEGRCTVEALGAMLAPGTQIGVAVMIAAA